MNIKDFIETTKEYSCSSKLCPEAFASRRNKFYDKNAAREQTTDLTTLTSLLLRLRLLPQEEAPLVGLQLKS